MKSEIEAKLTGDDITSHGHGPGFPAGALLYVKRTTAPDGFLKANGAAVSVSTYSDLDDAIYCGDANNATADCCYHCTDPGDPDGTRSTTGGYLVLPDERGEYPRGWDDARGVDMSRSLWAHQVDQNKSHNHTGTANSNGAHTHNITTRVSSVASTLSGVAYIGETAINPVTIANAAQSAGAHTHTLTINTDGGTEVRVRNNPWLACIKY
ncbi:MAG: tail fiber protein [Clostridia bacterium]|nr:tail fiber protein [Clostridia bacterium]